MPRRGLSRLLPGRTHLTDRVRAKSWPRGALVPASQASPFLASPWASEVSLTTNATTTLWPPGTAGHG
jgi:hypothetical protein